MKTKLDSTNSELAASKAELATKTQVIDATVASLETEVFILVK